MKTGFGFRPHLKEAKNDLNFFFDSRCLYVTHWETCFNAFPVILFSLRRQKWIGRNKKEYQTEFFSHNNTMIEP